MTRDFYEKSPTENWKSHKPPPWKRDLERIKETLDGVENFSVYIFLYI